MAEAAAPEVVVGLVAAPGAPAELAGRLATELPGELSARFPVVRWRIRSVEHGLVFPPAAAIAAGVFALITSDIWRLADSFGSTSPRRRPG